MLLIDSLYINNSGGFRLLDYLARTLLLRDISFTLLADERCRGRLDYCPIVQYMKASLRNRKNFYATIGDDYKAVLCFGNIPVPTKLKVPVYTYFHNINLLTLKEARSKKEFMTMWMKRQIFRMYKKNTDLWIVQTLNTATELKTHLHEDDNRVRIIPFYELSDKLRLICGLKHGQDYVYISNYTGAKGHETLLKAWYLLHQKGIDRTLHLTVNPSQTCFIKKIEKAQSEGVKVINHGVIPFEDVLRLYRQSKALVYPSHNESLGLGIIESITAGCNVIGSDMPFIHTICKPSMVFNPFSAESIADAIEKYEKGLYQKSELRINNMIDVLIELITSTTD